MVVMKSWEGSGADPDGRNAPATPALNARFVPMAYRVFISYSSSDLSIATQVRDLLTMAGAKVFLAASSLEPGTDLNGSIHAEIRACDMFVLLWSRNARESSWVSQEVGAASAQRKLLVPVLLEKGLEMPAFLNGLKYLPAFQDLHQALRWLQVNVAGKVQRKSNVNAILGIGGVLLLLAGISQNSSGQETDR